jgi:amidophosphoribosyltransferase
MGRYGESIVFASESCALDTIGAAFERDIEPGEIVVVEDGAVRSIKDNCTGKSSFCIFEYIYYSRSDSIIEGQQVYASRVQAGRMLAKQQPADADIVIGVPDSGLGAAFGYAKESGIPYEIGFNRNSYVGRTFIRPSQPEREAAVSLKLNALKSVVAGKRVVAVDDSIVRGTNIAPLVKQLRDAGAKEVHIRIASPQYIWPCLYGTDVTTRKELISFSKTLEEIREHIKADSFGFLGLEGLYDIAPLAKCGFCDACFTGNYPDEEKCATS